MPSTAAAATEPPAAPTLLSIQWPYDISWTLVPGATSYKLWISPNPVGGPYRPVYDSFGVSSGVRMIDMEYRNPWYWSVTAENDAGTSERSNTIAEAFPFGARLRFDQPPVPGDGSIGVIWIADDQFWTSYRLQWGTTSGMYDRGADLSPVTGTYTITGLTNGQRTYWRLTAVDINGAPWASAEDSAVPGAANPPPTTTTTAPPTTTTTAPSTTTSTPPVPTTSLPGSTSTIPPPTTTLRHQRPNDLPIPSGFEFSPVAPVRVFDSRVGGVRLAAGSTTAVDLSGAGLASDAAAVTVNLTALNGSGGFVTAWSCDGSMPSTSNVNPQPGGVSANLATVSLSASRSMCVNADASTDLIVDLQGAWRPATQVAG